jgi:hypothetical protein
VKREDLAHILRAASQIADEHDVLVVGSQPILGTYSEDQLPDAAAMRGPLADTERASKCRSRRRTDPAAVRGEHRNLVMLDQR